MLVENVENFFIHAIEFSDLVNLEDLQYFPEHFTDNKCSCRSQPKHDRHIHIIFKKRQFQLRI